MLTRNLQRGILDIEPGGAERARERGSSKSSKAAAELQPGNDVQAQSGNSSGPGSEDGIYQTAHSMSRDGMATGDHLGCASTSVR